MSKLSFRARALDPSKQMPIYLAEELPDLPEYSAINRAVPQMPSGMEKEEESEHHLQRAICTGLIIPTPEVYTTEQDFYDRNYPPNYRMPRQLIHMQPLGLEQDVPEYDMDSEDELWVNQQRKRLDLTPLKFEQMMDRLEKSSGQTVVTLNEAKALLKQDDEVSIAVYDYWLNKRLKMQHPLILAVKTENRPGASSNNPYLAFRRRTEKMQTRKNRKNDETSYEKMLKLRRDLQRATTMLEMVKRREKTKREQLHLSIEIFERRVQLKDFSGALLSELSSTLKSSRPAFAPLYANQYSHHSTSLGSTPTAVVPSVASSAGGINNVMGTTSLLTAGSAGNVTIPGGHLYSSASPFLNSANLAMADALNPGSRKEKRQYKKRKHKIPRDKQQLHQQQQHIQQQQQYLAGIGVIPTSATTGAVLGGNVVSGAGGLTGSTLHPHLPHHLQHLHRHSSSPAPNESNIETEEEDLAHKIGSESEEEAPFAFRRKQGCEYLRTRTHTGNWPWEPKEEYGIGETKYRYTLTSIRHPRPRCIGFARRRLGRGGRVMLDRVDTNFDEVWSHLDYTILETKTPDSITTTSDTTTTSKNKNKPASPPTVVDIVPPAGAASNHTSAALAAPTANTNSVNNANIPAITIKKEITDIDHNNASANSRIEEIISNKEAAEDIENIEDCEYEYSDDENDLTDEFGLYIQRDRSYHSCLSMTRRRGRRRRKTKQQSQRRNRCRNYSVLQQKNMDIVSRKLLYKLSQYWSLAENDVKNDRVNNLLNHVGGTTSTCILESKQEKVNGLKREDQSLTANPNWPNHRCSSVTSVDNSNKLNNINSSFACSFPSSSTLAPPCASNVVGNFTNSSYANINKNVNIGSSNSCILSDKINVIKAEVDDAEADNANINRPCTTIAGVSVAQVIKQEMIDSSLASLCSADDSNEPLSSIQKLNTALASDIMEDEENVNLAQLSNLIKIKKEVFDEADNEPLKRRRRRVFPSSGPASDDDDNEVSCFNQVADVIRVRDINRQRSTPRSREGLKGVNILIEDMAQPDGDSELSMMGGLSPTSSQRLDICNDLLSEIRRDWLHFRPKTPTETDKDDSYWGINMDCKLSSPLVDWSQNTPIAVEMVREPLGDRGHKLSLWKEESDNTNTAFISSAFKYEDLDPDTQLLQNSYLSELARGSSKSPETNNSAACLDLNFSGDSLNDINLLGEGDDADMLDNILQEVQIDDIKALNQATTFWNGILDAENVDAVVDGDVEAAAGLLDGIDDSKKGEKSNCDKRSLKLKGGKKSCALLAPVGSSTFSCSALEKRIVPNESFFKKEEPKKEPEEEVEELAIKSEPMELTDTKTNVDASVNAKITNVQQPHIPQIAPLIMTSTVNTININSQREVLHVGQQQQQQQQQQQKQQKQQQTSSPMIITQTIQQQLPLPPQHQVHQQQQQQHLVAHSTSVQVIGNAISLNQNESMAPVQQHQHQTTPAVSVTQHQPQQQQQQLTTIQVLQQPTTQQIRNVTVQQLQQLQLQQQQQRKLQQQQKLLLQRDLSNTTSASVIAQYVPTTSTAAPPTIMRQPTLTPIGASAVNNAGGQMIYTTSSGDVIAAGSQKIYLQKAPVSVTAGTQGVNIINTTSGQQLTVQNIAGVQHISSATGGNGSTSTGPLIVTTSARNAVQQLTQQQQQQMVGQPTQQIVWRQIGSTNVTTTPAGLLASNANADGTGNKIVWTSRPAQKRQLNGPESTDISKLLLNRKFSQRKIVQQQPQLLQQQSQDDDLSGVSVTISSQDTTTTTALSYNTQQQQQLQHQHQQQSQKLSGGKVIKMPSFPLLVPDNLQQQQQQQQQQLQQKHNTAAAIAANHNYSLQPTAAIITSQPSQQGNKIYFTTSSSGGAATNFTITNASELQTAAQKLQANNSNLKLNFVATNPQQQGLQQQQQQAQQQTVVLNKATMQQQQLLPQQLLQQTSKIKRERILNIIGAAQVDANVNSTISGTSIGSSTGDNNKRVLYTSLLNVKPLQKNNAGQMQVQIGPQGMAHAVLRSRIANNQAIFANMRTVPVATVSAANNNSHNNTTLSSSVAATTTLQVLTQSPQINSNISVATTSSISANLINTLSNNNSNTNNNDGNVHMQQQLHPSSSSTLGGDLNSSTTLTTISHSANDIKCANNILNMENTSSVVTCLSNSNNATTVNSSSPSNGSSSGNTTTSALAANTNNIQVTSNSNNATTINR